MESHDHPSLTVINHLLIISIHYKPSILRYPPMTMETSIFWDTPDEVPNQEDLVHRYAATWDPPVPAVRGHQHDWLLGNHPL